MKKEKEVFKREVIAEGCLHSAEIVECDDWAEKKAVRVWLNACGESMRGSWLHEEWNNTRVRVVLEWIEPENSEKHKRG